MVPSNDEIQRIGALIDLCRAKSVNSFRVGELTFLLSPVLDDTPRQPAAKHDGPTEHDLMPERDALEDLLHGAK